MSHPSDGPEFASRRMNGWKEIAAYFDRSVRTVQRWEAEHGLPVRRLGMGRAEVVSALVSDLEKWRSGAEAVAAGAAAAPASEAQAGDPAGGRPSSPAISVGLSANGRETAPRAGRRLTVGLMIASTGIASLAAGALLQRVWDSRSAIAAEPASFAVQDDRFVVRNASGDVLWHRGVGPDIYLPPGIPRIIDLDGDGRREVLAAWTTGRDRREASKVYCLGPGGRVLWTYQYEGHQTYGDRVYGPPYWPFRVFVTDAPAGKKYIWVANAHSIWYPSVLHKLDSTGAVLGEYWSSGWITNLEPATWDNRKMVLVGARNNEFGGASVALLDEARPSGSSPGMAAPFRCRTCSPQPPLAFVVFRKPARLSQLSVTSPVGRMVSDIAGAAVIWVDYAGDTAISTPVFFTLDHQLRPLRVDIDDRFEAGCLELWRQGKIPAFKPGEGLEGLRRVLWWDGTAMVEREVPPDPARNAPWDRR